MDKINGLVFFNADGATASALVSLDGGDQRRLRGTCSPSGADLSNGDDSLTLKTIANRKSDRHPAARGTLVIGGVKTQVAGFLNSLESGEVVIGLKADELPALGSCPW